MKVAIVGSRNIRAMREVERAVEQSGFEVTEVISGGANGVDTLAEQYAQQHDLTLTVYPPDWKQYGRSAGYRRNVEIVLAADAVIAVWNGSSPGTRHTMNLATFYNKPLYVYHLG